MFTPYSCPTQLSAMSAPLIPTDLVPVDEFGIPAATAALLANATPRVSRCVKRWLLDLADAAPVAMTAPDGTAYELKALPRAWQGRKLRSWMQDQREAQEDTSELTLRGAKLGTGNQVYQEEATDCLDGQAVLSVHLAGHDEPVGYATVLVSVRVPRVVKGPVGDYRVAETFDECHDVRAPQVELKFVLDEVFVLPQHRGNQLGTHLAAGIRTACITLLSSLEFVMAHAPLCVDLDAEVVSFAGAYYVNQVRRMLCDTLCQDKGWRLEADGYPQQYSKNGLRLQLRHDFQAS